MIFLGVWPGVLVVPRGLLGLVREPDYVFLGRAGFRHDLAFRAARVLPVRVALADLTIAPVHEKLPLVAAGNLPGRFPRLSLSAVHRSSPSVSGDFYTPTRLARHNVNVTLCHAALFPVSGRRETGPREQSARGGSSSPRAVSNAYLPLSRAREGWSHQPLSLNGVSPPVQT